MRYIPKWLIEENRKIREQDEKNRLERAYNSTKCQGRNCPRKDTCYRYTAKSDDEWQSWSEFDMLAECEYYWKIESEDK